MDNFVKFFFGYASHAQQVKPEEGVDHIINNHNLHTVLFVKCEIGVKF